MNILESYRAAARALLIKHGATEAQADCEVGVYIRLASEDPGEWAPEAELVIVHEANCCEPLDQGLFAALFDYYDSKFFERFAALDAAARCDTFTECINPAVSAVWKR